MLQNGEVTGIVYSLSWQWHSHWQQFDSAIAETNIGVKKRKKEKKATTTTTKLQLNTADNRTLHG